jgi:peroxiredoxin
MLTLPVFILSVFFSANANTTWRPEEGAELIGQPAPEFSQLKWLNCPPLTLAELRGKVVLMRFWLIDCPYCQRTAPALNELLDKYGKDGLVVIGIHHPKSDHAKEESPVRKGAEELHFKFPLAMDNSWATVNAYWLAKRKRTYTSATFLIDKHGIIRWIHPGGEIIRDDSSQGSAFASLEQTIKDLLIEE